MLLKDFTAIQQRDILDQFAPRDEPRDNAYMFRRFIESRLRGAPGVGGDYGVRKRGRSAGRGYDDAKRWRR